MTNTARVRGGLTAAVGLCAVLLLVSCSQTGPASPSTPAPSGPSSSSTPSQLDVTIKGAVPGVYDVELHDPELRLLQVAVR